METYVATTKISRKLFNRINRLLNEIDFDDDSLRMNNLIRELDAAEDSYLTGFEWNFPDGSRITIDIHSGQHNYYDDAIWHNADETVDTLFDCSYTLDEENEFCIENTYICKFEFEEDDKSENYNQLASLLFSAIAKGKIQNQTSIKWYEASFQEAIEKAYPGFCWWETLNHWSIWESLVATQDPALTALAILDIKKEDR
jgi:hypothetical protein